VCLRACARARVCMCAYVHKSKNDEMRKCTRIPKTKACAQRGHVSRSQVLIAKCTVQREEKYTRKKKLDQDALSKGVCAK
jgi:hypothetical protein